jgi:cobalamin biosynthesis protein CobW
VQEEFYPVMEALVERRADIDHVLIETSASRCRSRSCRRSTGRPSATLHGRRGGDRRRRAGRSQRPVRREPQAVDAQRRADPNLDHESPLHELFADQLSSADLVIVNKADLVADAQFADIEAAIRDEIPPQVKIVRATRGELDLSLLVGLEAASEDTIHLRHDHHGSADDGEHDHHHDDFDSVVVAATPAREATIAALQRVVEAHTIYRAKASRRCRTRRCVS